MELALYDDSKICHVCSALVIELPPVTYVSLFRDAGYGAATRVRISFCLDCWTVRELSRETLNPRTL